MIFADDSPLGSHRGCSPAPLAHALRVFAYPEIAVPSLAPPSSGRREDEDGEMVDEGARGRGQGVGGEVERGMYTAKPVRW